MKLKGEKMADELVSQQYEDLASSDSATQMRIAVGFKLLNVSLYGTLESHADDSKELLIMPSMNYDAEPFTLVELVDGLNSFLKGITGQEWFTKDGILNSLKKFLNETNLDSLKISIQQVFLHVKKPKSGESTTEYAFSLKISKDSNAAPKDFTFASIDSLAFGIWNTNNVRILSNMDLLSIKQLLE